MTMHLEQGLTTIRTTKRKRHITKGKMLKWTDDLRKYNKHMKRLGLSDHIMNINEYVDYVHGEWKPKVERKRTPMVLCSDSVEKTITPNVQDKKLDPPKLGNGKQISWKEKQERLEISRQYSIAPAYNKGPYMVVAREDLKTAGKKV